MKERYVCSAKPINIQEDRNLACVKEKTEGVAWDWCKGCRFAKVSTWKELPIVKNER